MLTARRRSETTLGDRLRQGVSVETALYIGIFLLAVLTRFWDLGSRALHHDETLHTYFSWLYAEGFGYRHDPMMHGPFLFHANALMYLLFGSTDYVSRVVPALLGVIVVMLPWFLRGEHLLGRWGALIASALILVSPTILFYSRFIREDIHTLIGVFLLFIAIARYVERPEPRWAILAGFAIGYLLTTKAVSYIAFFIFATFIGLAVAARSARVLLGVGAGAAGLYAAIWLILGQMGMAGLPGIPWRQPSGPEIVIFLRQLFLHPVVVAAFGVGLLAIVAAVWLLRPRVDPERGWALSILGDAPPGTTSAALRELLLDRRTLLTGAGLGLLVYTVLYTSLFTNMVGILSGTAGTLGYWLGQHDVQRGEQPWFYYLLLMPQYEFIAVLLSPLAALLMARQWRRARRGEIALTHRFYTRGLLLYWGVGMFLVLSWAGEKMPWLVIHIALPFILLSAALLGELVEWLTRTWRDWPSSPRRGSLLVGGGVAGLAVAGFLLMAWASAGPYGDVNGQIQRTLRPEAAERWWIVYLPGLLALGLLAAGIAKLGARRALTSATLGLTAMLVLLQIHAGWRMTYQEGDVPRDMLIYVQTSPDVTRVAGELERLSYEMTGGLGLEVWYDSGTQWPFNWYLHNFPNRRYFGQQLDAPAQAPIVLVARENAITPRMEQMLAGYTYQEYAMRWWFPEEATYRRFAIAWHLNNEARQNYQTADPPPYSAGDVIASVWSSVWSLREPQQQAEIFRLVAFRELPATIGSYRFRVYVRDDLLRYYDGIRY